MSGISDTELPEDEEDCEETEEGLEEENELTEDEFEESEDAELTEDELEEDDDTELIEEELEEWELIEETLLGDELDDVDLFQLLLPELPSCCVLELLLWFICVLVLELDELCDDGEDELEEELEDDELDEDELDDDDCEDGEELDMLDGLDFEELDSSSLIP